MKKIITAISIATAIYFNTAFAHGPHEHGIAHMNLVVEEGNIDIEIHSPLANFISFEHAPQTQAQEQEVIEMASQLYNTQKLFIFPNNAQCELRDISLHSEVIDENLLSLHAEHHENNSEHSHHHDLSHEHHADEENHTHGDLNIHLAFTCQDPENLNNIKINLFEPFQNLHEIKVQMITHDTQRSIELTSQSNMIKW